MENTQLPLIADTLETAISAVVIALGGNKVAGHMLWPSLDPTDAGNRLAHCMQFDRRDKLSPTELAMLLREGRKIGVHTLAAYLMHDAGYADPQPIEPEDERAALQRQFIEQSKAMQALFARMERAGLRSVA